MRAISFRAAAWLSLHRSSPHLPWPQRRRTEAWLPRRLLLIRHGESEANVDRSVYSHTPDWCIPLTARGHQQAIDCGRRVRHIVQDETLYIYYSPYQRARQTLEDIRVSLDPRHIRGEREDERLREQEMGNFQPMQDMDQTWSARNRYGRLFYRFPMGESGADVGDRVSCFFDSLLRERAGSVVPNMNEFMSIDQAVGRRHGSAAASRPSLHSSSASSSSSTATAAAACRVGASPVHSTSATEEPKADKANTVHCDDAVVDSSSQAAEPTGGGEARRNADEAGGLTSVVSEAGSTLSNHNVIIVSHGLLIRLFLGSWFRLPLEVTQTMQNPCNCAIVVLERDDRTGRMTITPQSMKLFQSDVLVKYMQSHSNQGR